MSKLFLKENPTLKDFQDYMKVMLDERNIKRESISEVFMLFLEECGELAKAARKLAKIYTDPQSEKFEVADEVADVFMYLLDISNKFDIDLEKAFRDKEEMNKKRKWG